ncbi:ATP12-domain-containing protein [Pluteus cervinus]|uniref:ATP12-domain-containing protein n=1 Tax=Pluteus cervinus TaxID=181527 RepID=A0ACD3B2H0_9AGAR|nr:ATP12-domain-containing protein [Pluteus cervinus]
MFARALCARRALVPRQCAHITRSRSVSSSSTWKAATATQSTPDGPAISETNRAEVTMQRFWKDVGISPEDNAFCVTLDDRSLKTPSGNTLLIPKQKTLLATLIAAEWDSQEKVLKPHALPMTSLAARAIDALADKPTREEVCDALVKYVDTDTISFYQDDPPPLVKLQAKHWDPLLAWLNETHGVELEKAGSILFHVQSNATKDKLRAVIQGFDAWQLAAMERATYATKSFVIALALVTKHITVEEAALAASVEVNSQIERWGEVEDTHDVDYQDVRRQLGSVACLLSNV